MATAKKPAARSSPPNWIAIVGAIVAFGGLAYSWFSHFHAKAEPAKPLSTAAPSSASPHIAASVSVSGSGAVGVGVMQGGTISVGVQPAGAASGLAPSVSKKGAGAATK